MTARKRGAWHVPRLYRYKVAEPGFRVNWNRYDLPVRTTIGVAVVVGRFAYCIKWRWAR